MTVERSNPLSFEAQNVYHELGHAAACERLGYAVTGIEVGDFPICRYQVPAWETHAITAADPLGCAMRGRQLLVTVAGRWCEGIAAAVEERATFEPDLLELFDQLDSGLTADEVIFEVDIASDTAGDLPTALAPGARSGDPRVGRC